jgi:hypothetical protein
MAQARRLTEGDKAELRVNERAGWVACVCTYADKAGTQVILDTEKHGRFSLQLPHADVRK